MLLKKYLWLFLAICVGVICQFRPSTAQQRIYGTLMSDPKRASTNVKAGIRLVTTAVSWKRFQPQENVVDATYVREMRSKLKAFRDAGTRVILDFGMHYPPEWIWKVPHSRFVNQYGVAWEPTNPGREATNGVYNSTIREKQAAYVAQVFKELGTDFFTIRLGWLTYSELHYPFTYYQGKNNCYWAFDDLAQGKAQGGNDSPQLPAGVLPCPVPGWMPGSPSLNHRSAARFINWYLDSLANYQDWQIQTVRQHFDGRLIVLYPSFGIRPGDLERAIAVDLNGSTLAEKSSPENPNGTIHGGQIQIGYDFARMIARLRDPLVTPYATNVGTRYSDDDSLDPTRWSPTHYLASLIAANPTNLQLFGENAGNGDVEAMRRSFTEMEKYGLIGLVWAFEGQLYNTSNGKYASLEDYAKLIRQYP
jgi:hypothetical protein